NGLWTCGVKTYPIIGDFYDKYATKVDKIYDAWGKTASQKFVVEQLRRFKPDVVLTHDVNGEYGHGAHKTCADLMQKCITTAANPDKFKDSAKVYGTWEVKKLYLHLYKENPIEMDWDQPLSAFGGKTGYEMAQEGYSWHFSQHDQGQKNKQTGEFEYFIVEPRDSDYSCYRFGLVHTTVGEDVEKNDFFENVPVE
ncbi:MAG: PIG-L family deacetylase, partial [Clostridia bacterium]|nr:PIG-L family deacetylase [Clostridia bacterium]